MENENVKIGEFTKTVINLLDLKVEAGTPIYIGSSNLLHMQKHHPSDFKKYWKRLERIIAEPDYVGVRDDGSVEYIKIFGLHIKVAVRVSGDGLYYARSLYHVDRGPADRLITTGQWKSLD